MRVQTPPAGFVVERDYKARLNCMIRIGVASYPLSGMVQLVSTRDFDSRDPGSSPGPAVQRKEF